MISLTSCIQIREEILKAQYYAKLGVSKSRTTAYHPAGDGLVEHFNRSLLQILRAYVDQSDWEQYLFFVLYAYRNAVHTSTGASPFELMFGRITHKPPIPSIWLMMLFPTSISFKLSYASLEILLKPTTPKLAYSRNITMMAILVLELLLLMIMCGFLPLQQANWIQDGKIIQAVKSPITYTIHDGKRTRTVQINRLRASSNCYIR